jgi:hypothetical protein
MTTTSFAKSVSTVLATLILSGWSAPVSADDKVETPKEQSAQPSTAPTTPAKAASEPTSSVPTVEPVAVEPTPPSEEPTPDPASITEVGVQRLPASAYPSPQTRGIPYGSLSLTFHGLQWPYMPAMPKGKRFVIGVSGWGWLDTSIQKFLPWSAQRPNFDLANQKYWKEQSRFVLRVTPTYAFDNDWFIQGQAEFVATGDQSIGRDDPTGAGADTDDLFLRIGQWNKWDFMVGRYEGWEVFHLGMGLDQNTFERAGAVAQGADPQISFYGLTDNQFRTAGAIGNMAFHYYPLRILRFELLGSAGSKVGPMIATRPVAILDLGWLKLKAGTEYKRETGIAASDLTHNVYKGVGGAAQFIFAPHIEFGLNAAQGTVQLKGSDGKIDYQNSITRTSYGLFANVSNGSVKHPLLFGVGGLYTHTEAQNDAVVSGVVDKRWLFQSYVAAQYVAFQQLYIKLVAGYSRGHWLSAESDPAISFDDEMYSLRLRFAFYF